MTISSFDILRAMSEGNMDIRAFPFDNIKSVNRGKRGWGQVVIAIDDRTAEQLLNTMMNNKCLVGMFVVADSKQFESVQKELQEKLKDE